MERKLRKKKSTWWRGKYSCWVFPEHSIWRLWQVVEGGSDRKWGWSTSSVQFSHSVMSDSLWPHGLQHARLLCPSSTPEACSNSCPLSWWCHPTILSSVAPFPPAFNLAQHQGLLQSQFFASGGQRIGASALTSVIPMNIHDWFPLGLIGWISLQSKGLSRVFSNITVQNHQFFTAQLSL